MLEPIYDTKGFSGPRERVKSRRTSVRSTLAPGSGWLSICRPYSEDMGGTEGRFGRVGISL